MRINGIFQQKNRCLSSTLDKSNKSQTNWSAIWLVIINTTSQETERSKAEKNPDQTQTQRPQSGPGSWDNTRVSQTYRKRPSLTMNSWSYLLDFRFHSEWKQQQWKCCSGRFSVRQPRKRLCIFLASSHSACDVKLHCFIFIVERREKPRSPHLVLHLFS